MELGHLTLLDQTLNKNASNNITFTIKEKKYNGIEFFMNVELNSDLQMDRFDLKFLQINKDAENESEFTAKVNKLFNMSDGLKYVSFPSENIYKDLLFVSNHWNIIEFLNQQNLLSPELYAKANTIRENPALMARIISNDNRNASLGGRRKYSRKSKKRSRIVKRRHSRKSRRNRRR
jgi:hypothetical protein